MFNKQAKRLACAAAAQLHKRQIGTALYRIGDGGCGLFGAPSFWVAGELF